MCDKIVQAMFNKYNLGTGFNKNYIKESYTEVPLVYLHGSLLKGLGPGLRCKYLHDGVDINYYSRVTTHLGDTDTFADYSIYVNNTKIVDITYE